MKLRGKTFFLLLVMLCSAVISASAFGVKHPEAETRIKFTKNKSQWAGNILYCAQLDGGSLFLERNCFTYNFYDTETLRKNHVNKNGSNVLNDNIRTHAFRVSFLNSLPASEFVEKSITADHSNYFIGKDKSHWASNVPSYREVNYKELYAGIDLQILGGENSMKYNFIVAPGATPKSIQLFYEGLDGLTLKEGSLKMKTSLNEMVEEKPVAYQLIDGRKVNVPCKFILKNSTVSFAFPRGYNTNYELVIDPVLVFACSSGSLADNFGMTATYDDDGNLYAGGTVYGIGYPVTLGAYDPNWNGASTYLYGRTDVVITKYDSTGTFLQYSTYLGGSTNTEVVSSLIVNSQNELMLFGATGSSDFPVTPNAFDTVFSGGDSLIFGANGTKYLYGTDLYLAKFSSNGSVLLASTFVGGSENEGANNSGSLVFNYGDYYRGEIQVDNAGNFYIASCTYSSDFPVTPGCLQAAAGGGLDGVVFKMDPLLTTMVWGSYLGGSQDDGCYALALDNLQNVYTTGGTGSSDFPSTSGSISSIYSGGNTDGFVTKIKNDGSTILSSTFVGTPSYDQTFLIQLDNSYNVYVIGQSLGNMPVSAGVYSNPNSKQFIWKMNNNLSSTVFTTIFGNGNGQVNISPAAFLVDICGNIYVCGWGGHILMGTPTFGMPVTPDAYQPATDGFNFHLMVLMPDATALMYGTYFGGGLSWEHVDGGTSRFDKKGVVYQAVCAGCGGRDDFPVTTGSWPYTASNYTPIDSDPNTNDPPSSGINMNDNCNMGTFKFDFQASGVQADAVILPNDTICPGDPVVFSNESSNAFNYLWNFGDGSPESTLASPTHSYAAPGSYHVTLIAIDSTGCLFSDTSDLTIVVAPIPVVEIGNDTILCQQPNIPLDAGISANIYNWSTGAVTQTITAQSAGIYWVEVSNGHCRASDTLNISVIMLDPFLGNDTSLCDGQPLQLSANEPAATGYLWSTGATTPSINVSASGQYWVTVTAGPCSESDTIEVNFIPYPVINLPASFIVCEGDSVVLNGGSPATAYSWSTGDTTANVTVFSSGTYSVTTTNIQCTTSASTTAQAIALPSLGSDTTLCDGQPITLSAAYPSASYVWSTGATASEINVSTSGTYWVTITFSGCQKSDTMSVTYIPYPVIGLVPTSTICPNDSVLLNPGGAAQNYLWSTGSAAQSIYASSPGMYTVFASNNQCSVSASTLVNTILFPQLPQDTTLCAGQMILLSAAISGGSYLWSNGQMTSSVTVNSPGQYWVITTVGLCQNKDTINISYVPYPVISLPEIVDLCPDGSTVLDPGPSATTYLWSTGAQTQTINAAVSGTYIVTASNAHCSVNDTTVVNVAKPIAWNSTETICNVNEYTLDAGIDALSYTWSTGESARTINVTESGVYWVSAMTANCTISDTITLNGDLASGILWFPNSFTPDNNGINDKFFGKGTDITFYHLMIFDRWGELIFETQKQEQGWDGFYKGRLAEQDVYVWKIKYKTRCTEDLMVSKIGHVTLVR
jgi:gliding motility-associated-like protein